MEEDVTVVSFVSPDPSRIQLKESLPKKLQENSSHQFDVDIVSYKEGQTATFFAFKCNLTNSKEVYLLGTIYSDVVNPYGIKSIKPF